MNPVAVGRTLPLTGLVRVGWLVGWCFESSQPLGIVSGLSERLNPTDVRSVCNDRSLQGEG